MNEINFSLLKRGDIFKFTCVNCGKEQSLKYRKERIAEYKKFLCTKCKFNKSYDFVEGVKKRRKTKLEKYGDENFSNREKFKRTCLKRYGVENVAQVEQVKEKIKQSFQNKTEEEKWLIKEKIKFSFTEEKRKELSKKISESLNRRSEEEKQISKEKFKQTCIQKYGVQSPLQSEEIREKIRQTNLEKYGHEIPFVFGSEEFQKNIKEKYGVENVAQLKEIDLKKKKTCLQRYGFESFSQTKEFTQKIRKKYEYDGIQFDSSWELSLWIYAHDKKIDIKKNYTSFVYEVNGKKHLYYPDFLYEGQLIEIKGDHFFNNGKMCNPFNHEKDMIFEAKHQCGLQNHVQFWTSKEMEPILKYIEKMYGKNYLKQFIRK